MRLLCFRSRLAQRVCDVNMTRRKRLPEKLPKAHGASLLRRLNDGSKYSASRPRDVQAPERARSYNRASKELSYGKSSFRRAQSWGCDIGHDIRAALRLEGIVPKQKIKLEGVEAMRSLGAHGKYPGNMRRDFMRLQSRLRRQRHVDLDIYMADVHLKCHPRNPQTISAPVGMLLPHEMFATI